MIQNDMPIGFGLSLAANEKAMAVFSSLSDDEKRIVIQESRNQHSKSEMKQFVEQLGKNFFE